MTEHNQIQRSVKLGHSDWPLDSCNLNNLFWTTMDHFGGRWDNFPLPTLGRLTTSIWGNFQRIIMQIYCQTATAAAGRRRRRESVHKRSPVVNYRFKFYWLIPEYSHESVVDCWQDKMSPLLYNSPTAPLCRHPQFFSLDVSLQFKCGVVNSTNFPTIPMAQ